MGAGAVRTVFGIRYGPNPLVPLVLSASAAFSIRPLVEDAASAVRVRRRGVVIVVVAVVVLLISLAALGFLLLMQTENKAAMVRGDQLQAESVAASGSDYLAAILERRARQAASASPIGTTCRTCSPGSSWTAKRTRTGAARPVQHLRGNGIPGRGPTVSVRRPERIGETQPRAARGVGPAAAGLGRQPLMKLPDMDESTADAMLDWIDRDRDARDFGAEADYYAGLDLPLPADGTPSSLEELLLARGVTREKMLGFDLNGDFRVDSWESERRQSGLRRR